MIPDMAVQPHTLQQEFALINVNIPNVIVEQVKWNILVLPLGRSLILTDLENLLNVSCNTHFCFFPFQKRSNDYEKYQVIYNLRVWSKTIISGSSFLHADYFVLYNIIYGLLCR